MGQVFVTPVGSNGPTSLPTHFTTSSPTVSPAPTARSWLVGRATDHGVRNGDDIFDGLLTIGHDIGFTVKPNHTQVELYDHNCVTLKNSTGLAVYIGDLGSNIGYGAKFFYDIGIDKTKLGDNEGNFVTYLDTDLYGNSIGSICLCTRVSTYESETYSGMTEVFFRETNFIINFNMTQNSFDINSVAIDDNDPDGFNTDVSTAFRVNAYQCNQFVPVSTPHSISQDENVVICIEPFHPNGLDVVHISNFNLLISAGTINTSGYISYDAVSFGASGWDAQVLTNVQESGKIKMISAPVVASFFIQGKTSIDVTGNVFLELDASKEAPPMNSFFTATIGLELGVVEGGCFHSLLIRMQNLF